MTSSVLPPCAQPITAPLSRLDALIAEAMAEIAAASAAVDAATAAIEAVEPHRHAHGYTAAGDCSYAGMGPEHFVPLAGLLARPWRETLSLIETIRRSHGFDYLLRAFPGVMAQLGKALSDEGSALLATRDDVADQHLPDLYARKPMLALGMVWRLFGFHRRDRHAWVGAFAYGEGLAVLIGSIDDLPEDMCLGDALAATVAAHHTLLTPTGLSELHRRDERRDAARQASWAEVPEPYRTAGSWRCLAPTSRQRHLMRRIEAARCLPMTVQGCRGDISDWITGAGGNPRFRGTGEEQV